MAVGAALTNADGNTARLANQISGAGASKCSVRKHSSLVTSSTLHDCLRALQRVVQFSVDDFITQAGIEALDVTDFLARAGFDVGCLGSRPA